MEERDCVCNADNAQQQANSCAACVKANVQNNNDDDDDDDDLADLFSACNWNYADVSATSSSDTAVSTQSTSGTSSVITTTQTFLASTTTETESDTTTTETFPASTVTSTGTTSPTETDDPDNAAAGLTVGVGIIAAGLMAVFPVLL